VVVTALDTHAMVKDFLAAGFTGEQAESITNAVRNAQDLDLSSLATKADLQAAIQGLKAEMEALRAATKADIETSRLSTKADIDGLRLSTKADIAEVKSELFRLLLAQTALIIGAVVGLMKLIGH
jgi:hypothetical protein